MYEYAEVILQMMVMVCFLLPVLYVSRSLALDREKGMKVHLPTPSNHP